MRIIKVIIVDYYIIKILFIFLHFHTPDKCDVQNLNNVLEISLEPLRKIDSESYPSEKIG